MNTLNIADILGLLFLGFGILDGFLKGFVKKGTSLMVSLVTLIIVYVASPYVEGFFRSILPASLLPEQLLQTDNEIYQMLLQVGVGELAENYMHILAARVLALIATYIVVKLLLRTLVFSLGILVKVPGLSLLNRLLGACFGFIQQLLTLWLLFLVVAIFSATGWGESLYQVIHESTVMVYFYENNLLMILGVLLVLKV
jgi:hypothetical protein